MQSHRLYIDLRYDNLSYCRFGQPSVEPAEKASGAVSWLVRCLPQSEGRALNTGCFMRYSDRNFLNLVRGNDTSTRRIVAGAIAAASATAVLGWLLGFICGSIEPSKRNGKL